MATPGAHRSDTISDTEIKATLDRMPCRERAALFAHWVDEYPKELHEARNITQGVMDGIFKDLNKKFKDADTKFRSSHGENHTVSLKAIEAISIYKTQASTECQLHKIERLKELLLESLLGRNTVIDGLLNVNSIYHNKLQDLMWVTTTKKFVLYGNALESGNESNAKSMAALQVKVELQESSLELLKAQMTLMRSWNVAAQHEIKALKVYVKWTGADSEHGLRDVAPESMSWSWNDVAKDLDAKQKGVMKATKKTMQAKLDYQLLRGTQDWQLFEKLFKFVQKHDFTALEIFCQDVYGSAVQVLKIDPGLVPSSDEKFRQVISNMNSQVGKHLRQEMSSKVDEKVIEEWLIATRVENYLPPALTASAAMMASDEHQFVPREELLGLQLHMSKLQEENTNLNDVVEEYINFSDTAVSQAKRYREDLDVHLSTCRAQDIKEQKIDLKNQEFMRAIMSCISDNESPSNMNDDEKRAYITGRVKALVKERDEAVRKNAPLQKKIGEMEKNLDEKIRDFGRTLESRSEHEESLKAKITGLQSSLDAKQKVIQDEKAAAIKETDTWSKRVQKGHDKVAQLTRDIQKITSDCDDFRSQNDRLLTEISQIKQDTEDKNSEFVTMKEEHATMRKELDESIAKARSLRSNEQMVKDQIKKAVREAEDAKEEEITRLIAQVAKLEQGKKADEENIRELSRLRYQVLE